MFTGIIEAIGIIKSIERHEKSARIYIQAKYQDLKTGESIAVNGICLTVTSFDENGFCCDISLETLTITQAKNFQIGSQVNLERSLKASDRLGGHFVLGHVDGVAKIKNITQVDEYLEVTFGEIAKENTQYLISKGSIAINGVSLTINKVFNDGFSIMLIPHTLQATNLHLLQKNEIVNLEYDYLAKIILNRTCEKRC